MLRCLVVAIAAVVLPLANAAQATSAVEFNQQWLEPFFKKTPGLRQAAGRFKLDDWPAAAAGFEKALMKLPAISPDHWPAKFLFATSLMNLSQWERAGTIFEEMWESYPLLGPYHAYNAARCRLLRGDLAGALGWAGRVPADAVVRPEAALLKIDALAKQKRWADVETESKEFLERFPKAPRRVEALSRQAEAGENLQRPAVDVAKLYRSVWAEAPTESWAARAETKLGAMAAAPPSAADWMTRGMDLFDRNQNGESEAAFASALVAADLDKALACRARYHRAQSVWKQRQRPRAAPLFKEAAAACTDAGDQDLLVKSLYQGARCLAGSGEVATALANYAQIEEKFPGHSYADDARLRAAELAEDAHDDAQVTKLLAEIPTRYPAGDLVSEALWRLALKAIRTHDWKTAILRLDDNLRRVPREDIWYAEGRALYWKARVLEKKRQPADAKSFYRRAVLEYPLSVYALLSLERMKRLATRDRQALIAELRAGMAPASAANAPITWKFAARPVFGEPGFRRAVELARMGIGGDARRELARLDFVGPEGRDAARKAAPAEGREDALWIGAVLLDRGGVWSTSHAVPRYSLTSYRKMYPAGRGEAAWRIAYPRAFPEIVSSNCRANTVPEALQWAIMREESAFSPRIESFANALGLTQMLVKTAQRFCPTKVTREQLLDPAGNVELGSRFLAFLLQHFGGAVPLAISGYNAGEAAVDKWLRERGTVELDEFLETIPYDETRNYTKRVLASYFAYSWLYTRARPVPPVSFSVAPGEAHPARPRSP